MHTRTQKGEVYRKGQKWYLRYFDFRIEDGQLQRKRLCKPLCNVADMNKTQAREEARRFLETINRPVLAPETAVKFVNFVDSVYFPRVEQRTRPSTYRGYKILWTAIKPFCDGLWTRDVRTRHVQAILDVMAQTGRFNTHSMQHIKSFLSGVFRLADQQGYYEGANPVRETSLPKTRQAEDTHAYSLEEILMMLDAVPEPASTMLATAAFTGVRRGELRGMLWQNYKNREFLIGQSIWNGIATDPKSKKSRATVPIIPKLAARLTAHRKTQNNPISGPVFRNGAGNAVDPDSVLHRVILPALNVCGVCSKMESEHKATTDHEYERNKVLPQWRGWHSFRRGLGTNLHRIGVDDLTIQAILRHSNVAVTQKCYIKTASEESHAAMQKFEAALNATQVPPIRRVQPTKGVM